MPQIPVSANPGHQTPQKCTLRDVRELLDESDDEITVQPIVHKATVAKSAATTTDLLSELRAGGVDAVELAVNTQPAPEVASTRSNWVGLLLEYRGAHPSVDGTKFIESSLGTVEVPRFGCTVEIYESPNAFVSDTFARKKDAKQNAANKAIQWLIDNSHMPADGSPRFPKASQLPPIQIPLNTDTSKGTTSYGQQAAELALRLGLSPPGYCIDQDPGHNSFWSIYAHFNGDPRVDGKVGLVSKVYGRKNAKEACAREVLLFLRAMAAHRAGLVEETDKKRTRDSEMLIDLTDDMPERAAQKPKVG